MTGRHSAGAGFLVEVREPGRLPLQLLITDRLPVGRACDGLLLSDPRLSRNHCELRVVDDALILRDGGSSNGTVVGAEPVVGPVEIAVGDVITLGDTTVTVIADHLSDQRPDVDRGEAEEPPSALQDTLIGDVREAVAAARSKLSVSVVGGTLTMAFTDIVGSTDLNGRLGDRAWFDLLRRHDEVVRATLVANNGTEVKAQGDGFLLTFGSARRALCFATELQARLAAWRAINGVELQVRIGIHTGEVIHDHGDLFGRHVNYAARVAALAGPSEILASELVTQLTAPMADFTFGPPRTVRLKGFAGAHPVRPVLWT